MKIRTLLFIAALSSYAASAHAQAQQPLELQGQTALEMPRQMRWQLFGVGLAGSALAVGGTGLVSWMVYRSNDTHEDDNIGALVSATAVGGTLAILFVPLSTAAFIYHAGKRRGYRCTLGRTFAGALGGFAVGSLVGGGVYAALDRAFDVPLSAALVASITLGVAAVAGITMRSYRRGAERRMKLAPSIAPAVGARGLTLGVSGRF